MLILLSSQITPSQNIMCTSKRTVGNNAVHVYFPVTHKSSAGTHKKIALIPQGFHVQVFLFFFKAASLFSLTRKEGPANVEMMRVFLFCFLAYHFHSPSGITQERIADTLDMTAGLLVKHSDTKQNSRANVLYNQKSAYSHSEQALK